MRRVSEKDTRKFIIWGEGQYSRSKSFSSGVKNVWVGRSGKKLVKGLTGNKAYYIRIRAFAKINGEEWYGPWSAIKSVVIKQKGTKSKCY